MEFIKGARVNVTIDDVVCVGVVDTPPRQNGKKKGIATIEIAESEDTNKIKIESLHDIPADQLELRTRGRKSLRQTMTDDEVSAAVDALLDKLRSTHNQGMKKQIRRKLRALGHYGGTTGRTLAKYQHIVNGQNQS